MANRLTLQPIIHAGDGPRLPTANPTVFEVVGLPPGDEALLRRVGNRWKVMRLKNGVRTSWSEGYESAEDALAVVQAQFDAEPEASAERW